MTKTLRVAAAGIAVLFASLAGGCADEPTDGVLSELKVTVAKPSIAIADFVQATASGLDQYNKPIAAGEVVWSSTGAATVSQTGVVTGVSVGNATIRATVVGRPMYAEVQVGVTVKPASSLGVSTNTALVARINQPFGTTVFLLDADGKPVQQSGVPITVSYSGGGTISGTLTATTNLSGLANFQNLSVNGASGKKQLTFTAPALTSATQPLTVVSGVASRIEILGGNNQTGVKGQDIAPVLLRVVDIDGYPVDGVTVTFTIGEGGGKVRFASRVTEAGGIAGSGEWTLGAVGTNTLIATAQGATAPATFAATATPLLASLRITVPKTSIAVGESMQATLSGLDDTGAPFLPAGTPQWLVQSLMYAVATPSGIIIGSSPGLATIIVSFGGRTTAVNISVVGTAARRLQVTSYPVTVVNGAPFAVQPVVQLVDDNTSLPVAEAGHVVTASIIGPSWNADQTVFSLGTLTGSLTAVTDATGAARFSGLGVVARTFAVGIVFRSDGIVPVTSRSAPIAPGAPVAITVDAGNNQSAPAGSNVPTQPAVIVRDVAGTPVPGVSVTFAVATGGGSVTGATVTTDTNGRATLGSWTLGTAAASNTLTVSSPSVPGTATISATARPF